MQFDLPTRGSSNGPAEAGSPRQMVFEHGIGWMSLTTVPIGLVGLAVTALGGHGWLTGKWAPGASLGLLGVGLGTFLVCLAGTLWRLRKVIDPDRGAVTDSWWWLGASGTCEHRLGDFQAVGLVHATITSDAGQFDRYKVYLAGQRDGRTLLVYLTEYSHPDRAEQKAREVADLTGLRLVRTSE